MHSNFIQTVSASCVTGITQAHGCMSNAVGKVEEIRYSRLGRNIVEQERRGVSERARHVALRVLMEAINIQQDVIERKKADRRNSDTSIGNDLLKQLSLNIDSFLNDANLEFPVTTNRMSHLLATGKVCQSEIFYFLTATRPIVHDEVYDLIERFLAIKKAAGYNAEKRVYWKMDTIQLITRLFHNRTICYSFENSSYMLRNGEKGQDSFLAIGTGDQTEPLILENYLSLDEIKLASLLITSSPTAFINDGSIDNKGKPTENQRSFQIRGIVIAVCPPNFQRELQGDYRDMVVDCNQNNPKNGFGIANRLQSAVTKLWADFYKLAMPAFPSYDDLTNGEDLSNQYISLSDGKYFNAAIYRKRMQLIAETMLLEANLRAAESNRQAYVYVSQLGLDKWPFSSEPDRKVMMDQYLASFGKALAKLELDHVGAVGFSGLSDEFSTDLNLLLKPRNVSMRIFKTNRNPCEKLSEKDDDMLLVVVYPTTSCALPGNDYWQGVLDKNDEQAIACSSLLGELHNPHINPAITGENTKIVHPEYDDV